MTEQQIDRERIRKLADAATPGPWTPCTEGWATISSGSDSVVHAYHPRDCCHECGEPYDMEPGVAIGVEDLEFIAAARTAVPQLLDHIDLQERELDAWMTRACEAEQRAWRAEARIRALEDVLDAVDGDYDSHGAHRLGVTRRIRRALEE